jgi:hypothetical protein
VNPDRLLTVTSSNGLLGESEIVDSVLGDSQTVDAVLAELIGRMNEAKIGRSIIARCRFILSIMRGVRSSSRIVVAVLVNSLGEAGGGVLTGLFLGLFVLGLNLGLFVLGLNLGLFVLGLNLGLFVIGLDRLFVIGLDLLLDLGLFLVGLIYNNERFFSQPLILVCSIDAVTSMR